LQNPQNCSQNYSVILRLQPLPAANTLTRPIPPGFAWDRVKFRLDTRNKFFTVRVVKPWHWLPREVGDAPSLEPFQARLDGALSTLTQLQMSLLTAGGWARWPLKAPSNPKRSVILRNVFIAACMGQCFGFVPKTVDNTGLS